MEEEYLSRFERDGYVVIPGLLSVERVAELRTVYDELVAEAEDEDANNGARIQRGVAW